MGSRFRFKKVFSAFTIVWAICLNGSLLFAQYCAPQYTYGCQINSPVTADYINKFSTTNGVANITNNNTGCNMQPNNFIYYAGMTVSAAQGCSFGVSMKSGNAYPQGFAIWIDWNSDFDYNDAGELVFSSNPNISEFTLAPTGVFGSLSK